MLKENWLLVAIGDRIQPIQLQKTMFKFAMESGAPPSERYEFTPYNWGPCSFQIYESLNALRSQGLIEMVPTGRGWSEYTLTGKGKVRVSDLLKEANALHAQVLDRARTWVVGRSFERLLRDVYREYPEYSTESMFTER